MDVKELVEIARDCDQKALPLPPSFLDDTANALEALSAENERIRGAAQFVHDRFATDMAQGYRTKDKEFAMSILGKALTPTPSLRSPPPSTPQIS